MESKKKKSTLKKILKWILGFVLVLFIILISTPYLFKDKIKELLISNINKNLDAVVFIDDIELSFIKKFPLANVSLSDISLINKIPFEGDTLFNAREIELQMKLTELIKSSDQPMKIESFSVEKGLVNILVNKDGQGNYDISKSSGNPSDQSSESSSLSFDIQQYELVDIDFIYHNQSSELVFKLNDIFHSGKGNFSENILDLNTDTKALMSLNYGETNYMDQLNLSLDAVIGIDLENLKFSFKDNQALINHLPLEFSGYMQFVGEEMNQSYDLEFHTPNSSFKNLLGVVPKQYAGNLENVKTQGNFDLKGTVVGMLDENVIPTFDISLIAKNAMFQYAKLPKAVNDIYLDAKVVNQTGNIDDTSINIPRISFRIDQDLFKANTSISNLIQNPEISLKANGIINLENLSNAYPIPLKQKLSGLLNADIKSSFDMESIEKKRYKKIKNSGKLALENFVYESEDLVSPFLIDKTSVVFSSNNIQLKEFTAKTGETDLNITGNLDNLYGFLLNEEQLKGKFQLQSSKINLNDFMNETTASNEKKDSVQTSIKIPKFLDCEFKAKARKVIYDDISLANASGTLYIKDETVRLQNLQMKAFDGDISMNGTVSTKNPKADFTMNLGLEDVDVKQSFGQLETLNTIVPIGNFIGGKLNSKFSIDGKLNEEMTPDMNTISGDLLGQLLNTKLDASNSKVMSYIGKEIPFIDVNKLNLKNLKTKISFKEGNVVVKPFEIKYEDIAIEVGGKHGFDQSMNYNLKFNVPAKYLGKEVTDVISKFSKKEQEGIQYVPVNATLTGSFSDPVVKTDIKKATSDFISNVVEQQKKNLLNKGKDKLLNLLGKDKDSTKSKKKNLLNSLLKKKKKN